MAVVALRGARAPVAAVGDAVAVRVAARRPVAGLPERHRGPLLNAGAAQVAALHDARRVQVVAERDRRARGQAHRHLPPVLAADVVDHRPALQQRLARAALGEDHPVGRLPHRRLDHVADREVVLARAGQADVDGDLLEHALAGGGVEAAMKLQREVTVAQGHAADLRQADDLHALAAQQADAIVARAGLRRRDPLAVRRRRGVGLVDDLLDHDDAAAELALGGAEHDLVAAQRVEHLREAALPRRQRRQRCVGPRLRVERHRDADRLAVAAVDHRQALEQVVDLILADLDRQHVALDPAAALEVADPVAIEDHPVEGQGAVGGGVGVAAVGAADGEDEERGEGQREAWAHSKISYGPDCIRGLLRGSSAHPRRIPRIHAPGRPAAADDAPRGLARFRAVPADP